MFNFTPQPPANATAAPTAFTFSPPPSQPFVFGAGVQNTSTIPPSGNPPPKTTAVNFSPSGFANAPVFGTNQLAPTNVFGTNQLAPANVFGTNQLAPTNVFGTNQLAPANVFGTNQLAPTNVFGTNSTGSALKFSPVSAQEILHTKTNKPLVINLKFQCISAMKEYLSKSMDELRMEDYQLNRKTPYAKSSSNLTNFPFTSGAFSTASTAPNMFAGNNTAATTSPFDANKLNTTGNLFNQQPTPAAAATSAVPFTFGTTPNPFAAKTSTLPAAPSVFTSTTTTPFGTQPVTTPLPFSFLTATNTSKPVTFTPQQPPNINIFSQQPTTTPVASTPAVPIINSTASTNPIVNNFAPNPFSYAATATSVLKIDPTAATTTASPFSSQLFSVLPTTQSQPVATTSSSTIISSAPSQDQNSQQSISLIQQRFLAASLLDPYANRGKKDFTNIDQIQVPPESTVVSTSSTPIPITLPIQTNSRKVPSSRSSVDVNFKLKPVSSSSSDDTNQQPTTSIGQMKSTLSGNFTDEEELVLLSRTKMSKLRLSNTTINSPNQPDPIRSLYPLRSLAELEKLTNVTPRPSSTPPITTTIPNERISRSSNEIRNVSPNPSKQSSSPIIPRKSNNNPQTYALPILTRDNYYMKPTLSELKSLFNNKDQCILKQFTVGHEKYGSVTFYGNINIAGLNLDEIIEINRHEVIVYPDDNNKPSVGEELNLPARITLLDVYPIDRTTRKEITDIQRIKAMNYHEHLKEMTKKFDGEFINYEIHDGSWTFMVKHFTRYGLDDN